MTTQTERDGLAQRSPGLLRACGIIGLFGCAALAITNAVGSMIVPDHDWIADTVSDLAAGEYEIVQDMGLHAYSAALLACAIGAAHHHLGGARWSLGIASLAILALCVEIIGVRNEYGDGDSAGIVIHREVVYALGVFFTAAPLLMASGMGRVSALYRRISIACAVLWALGAPVFFLLPTSIDGIWERGLGIVTIVWVASLSWMLIRAAGRVGR